MDVVDVLMRFAAPGARAIFYVCEADYRGQIYGEDGCRERRPAAGEGAAPSEPGGASRSRRRVAGRIAHRRRLAAAAIVTDTRSDNLAAEASSCARDDATASEVEAHAVVAEGTDHGTTHSDDAAPAPRDAAARDGGKDEVMRAILGRRRRATRARRRRCSKDLRSGTSRRCPLCCVRTSRPVHPRRRCSTTSASGQGPFTTTSRSRSAPTVGEARRIHGLGNFGDLRQLCLEGVAIMTIDIAKEHEIRRLYDAEKWKRGTIASELGVHPDVVDRVLDRGADRALPAAAAATTARPVRGFIDETLKAHPRLRATRLFDMIRSAATRAASPSSAGTWPRCARSPAARCTCASRRSPASRRRSTGPTSARSASRAACARSTSSSSARLLAGDVGRARLRPDGRACAARSCAPRSSSAASPASGSSTTRRASSRRHGDAVRSTPGMLEIAARCTSRRGSAGRTPTDKGGVERAIRYLKTASSRRARSPRSRAATAALDFIRDVANPRPHPRRRTGPSRRSSPRRRRGCSRCPTALPETDLVAPARRQDRLRLLRTNRYSVPPRTPRATLTLVACDTEVRLLDGDDVVARHARAGGSISASRPPSIARAPRAEARGADPEDARPTPRRGPRHRRALRPWVDVGRNVGSLIGRTGKLLDLYGAAVLAQGRRRRARARPPRPRRPRHPLRRGSAAPRPPCPSPRPRPARRRPRRHPP